MFATTAGAAVLSVGDQTQTVARDAITAARISSYLGLALAGDSSALGKLEASASAPADSVERRAALRALQSYRNSMGSYGEGNFKPSLEQTLRDIFKPVEQSARDTAAAIVKQVGTDATDRLAASIAPDNATATAQLRLATARVSPWVWVLTAGLAAVLLLSPRASRA